MRTKVKQRALWVISEVRVGYGAFYDCNRWLYRYTHVIEIEAGVFADHMLKTVGIYVAPRKK